MTPTLRESSGIQSRNEVPLATDQIRQAVEDELRAIPIIDIHTHLFKPSLGSLGLWGIDELLTYHYLEAELFRSSNVTPDQYWALTKTEKADLIWRTLFVEHLPVSEATRGVVAVLQAFDLPTKSTDLSVARRFFAEQDLETHIQNVFKLAGISEAVMTNDPLDPDEAPLWEKGTPGNALFHPVLRLDRILNKWTDHWKVLQSKGYKVEGDLSRETISEVRRFVDRWCELMKPVYMAVSLPDTFQYPEESTRGQLLRDVILPACRHFDIPLSLMIGVRYQVNPAIKLAGDAVGKSDLRAVEHLCREFPANRFLVSILSRENQHELCVYARKFANLMPFGCWWFLNNPSIVEEITRERIEMLGSTFIPQHSDARVLEQVIYKWRNTRRTMASLLANTYSLVAEDGRPVTREEIAADINRLFRTNFEEWVGKALGREKT
jgi:hypothetical protein